jgi:ankyrin repeat protein
LQRPDIEPDLQNDVGHTPIVEAAKSVDYFPWSGGYEAIVRMLLEPPDVDIDYKDDLGWRPLYSRAIHGRNEAVIQLLRSLRPDWGSWNYERKDRVGNFLLLVE